MLSHLWSLSLLGWLFLVHCDDDVDVSSIPRQRSSGCLSTRGQFPHQRYCDQFYSCWDEVVTIETCPQGLMYNTLTRSCDYKDRVDCSGRPRVFRPRSWSGECVTDWGSYRVASNCSLFYICYAGIPFEMQCGGGTVFNQDQEICDWDYNVPECFQGFSDISFPSQGLFGRSFLQSGRPPFVLSNRKVDEEPKPPSNQVPRQNVSPLKLVTPQGISTTKTLLQSNTVFTQLTTKSEPPTTGIESTVILPSIKPQLLTTKPETEISQETEKYEPAVIQTTKMPTIQPDEATTQNVAILVTARKQPEALAVDSRTSPTTSAEDAAAPTTIVTEGTQSPAKHNSIPTSIIIEQNKIPIVASIPDKTRPATEEPAKDAEKRKPVDDDLIGKGESSTTVVADLPTTESSTLASTL